MNVVELSNFLFLLSFFLSYSRLPLSRCYRTHEQEKNRAYDEWIREVERACFSPLVFAASGGMGPVATTVYRKLASLLSFVFFIAKV